MRGGRTQGRWTRNERKVENRRREEQEAGRENEKEEVEEEDNEETEKDEQGEGSSLPRASPAQLFGYLLFEAASSRRRCSCILFRSVRLDGGRGRERG